MLGFNGTNMWENATEVDLQRLADATPTDTTLVLRFRADKYEAVPDYILQKVKSFSDSFPENKSLKFIYCYNVRISDIEDTLNGVNFFLENNIPILAFQAGNEEFSRQSFDFDWSSYQASFQPHRDVLKDLCPDIPHLVFLAARPKGTGIPGERRDHSIWNENAFEYINSSGDCPCVHLYLNAQEIPEVAEGPPIIEYSPNKSFPEVEQYYDTIFTKGVDELQSWETLINYIEENTAQPIYVTEYGPTVNVSAVQNTVGYHMLDFLACTEFSPKLEVMLKHNGISSSNAGCISPTKYGEPDTSENSPNEIRLSLLTYNLLKLVEKGEVPVIKYPYIFPVEGDIVGNFVTSDNLMDSLGTGPYMTRQSTVDRKELESTSLKTYGFGVKESEVVDLGTKVFKIYSEQIFKLDFDDLIKFERISGDSFQIQIGLNYITLTPIKRGKDTFEAIYKTDGITYRVTLVLIYRTKRLFSWLYPRQ